MKASVPLLTAGVLLLAFGCKGSSDDTASTSPTSGTATTTGAAATSTGGAAAAATGGYAAVQAIFTKSCMPCHGSQRPKGGVDLTSYEAVMKGGSHGPIVVAGSPDKSDLIAYINGTKQPRMPKNAAPLSDADTKTISDWIQAGAKGS